MKYFYVSTVAAVLAATIGRSLVVAQLRAKWRSSHN